MIKRLWFLLVLLWAAPAAAQNTTCATRPAGDNSNACASTAFVHGATNVGLPTAATNQLYGGSGAAGQANVVSIGQGLTLTGEVLSATPQSIANVSGSAETTTGTCVASNPTIAIAAARDFVNGQGLGLEHCGATFTGAAPTGLAVSSTGATFQGPAGSTTYAYQVACVDNAGGVGAATSAVTITNGAATLGVVVQSATPTLAWNQISWTTTCPAVAVWRNIAAAGYHLIGVFTNAGLGTLVLDDGLPQVTIPWVPDTPTVSALNDRLVTTISSGGGTTTLTLAASPSNAASGALARHDDTAAINTYLAANSVAVLPAGTYNIEAVTLPTSLATFSGAGAGATSINGWSVSSPVLYATSMPQGFSLHNMSIFTEAMGTPGALTVSSTSACSLYNLIVSGNFGLSLVSDSQCSVLNINVAAWYAFGIQDQSGTSNNIGSSYLTGTRETPLGDGIELISSDLDNVHDNNLNGSFFGIVLINTQESTVQGNDVQNSWREGLHISANGSNNRFLNNHVDGHAESVDFCMSMSDDTNNNIEQLTNQIQGNFLVNCGNAGIAIGAIGGTNPQFDFNVISDNIIQSANLDNFPGQAAIVLNGSTLTSTYINNTTIINGANIAYVVKEFSENGTPDHTQVGTIFGGPVVTAKTLLIGTGSVALTAATTTNSTGN